MLVLAGTIIAITGNRVAIANHSGEGGRKAPFSTLQIIKGCIAFDTCTGRFHRVTDTAAFLIEELKKHVTVAEITDEYRRRFNISQSVAERDVELFLNDLTKV